MGAALALLLTAAAFAFVARPLIQRRRPADVAGSDLAELLSERDLALEDLRDLDFDHDLGNLSEADHQELREQSKRRAVAVLKQLQAESGRVDEEIEQAVAALRGTLPKR
jgi:type II secretory pathway component PulM